jgi:hypothetical protein
MITAKIYQQTIRTYCAKKEFTKIILYNHSNKRFSYTLSVLFTHFYKKYAQHNNYMNFYSYFCMKKIQLCNTQTIKPKY